MAFQTIFLTAFLFLMGFIFCFFLSLSYVLVIFRKINFSEYDILGLQSYLQNDIIIRNLTFCIIIVFGVPFFHFHKCIYFTKAEFDFNRLIKENNNKK